VFCIGVEGNGVKVQPGCFFVVLLVRVGNTQIDPSTNEVRFQIKSPLVSTNWLFRLTLMRQRCS